MTVEEVQMASPSKFDMKSLRQCISCDFCGKANPSKRCSQCRCYFYCSIECQKDDWTKRHKKFCMSHSREVLQLKSITNSAEKELSPQTALNTCCAICLEEPIINPIVLKACRHAFCSICLFEWQKYQQNGIMSFSESCTSSCPMCRLAIQKTSAGEALEKAEQYIVAGQLVNPIYTYEENLIIVDPRGNTCSTDFLIPKEFPCFKNERQRRFYQLAMDLIDPVILHDPFDLHAICLKGQALRYVHPEEAIKLFKMALDIDVKADENEEKLNALQEQMPDPYVASYEEQIKYLDAYNALALSKDFQINQIGAGPFRLFPIKIWLAEAYESAGKYVEAFSTYNSLLHKIGSDENLANVDRKFQLLIFTGVSRCFFIAKDFSKAKVFGEMALQLNRQSPGNHLLLAQSLWELGAKQMALKTLKRGILYETPSYEENRQRNIQHLERWLKK